MESKSSVDSRTPDELVAALRKDVRLVAISQFVHLFKPHQQIDFSIQVSSHPSQTGLVLTMTYSQAVLDIARAFDG